MVRKRILAADSQTSSLLCESGEGGGVKEDPGERGNRKNVESGEEEISWNLKFPEK